MMSFMKVSAIATALIWSGAALAAGDAAKGEVVFKQCKICHMIGPGAKPLVGPEQNGVVGSVAGSRPGYNYSPAMKEAGKKGLVWTGRKSEQVPGKSEGNGAGDKDALSRPKESRGSRERYRLHEAISG